MTITTTFIEALHRLEETGNLDQIANLFSDDATLANPLVVRDAREPQSAEQFWKAYRGAFSEIESEFVNVVENEGVAILEWRSDGLVDAQAVSYSGVSVIEFDGERIKAFRAYFDPRELVARISTGHEASRPSYAEH